MKPSEVVEDWWCWECANLGIFPADIEMGTDDMDCPCCEENSHDFDAELPPPCHPRARAIALAEAEEASCVKCGTSLKYAIGIGPYCPSKVCDAIDNQILAEAEK